jgi:hypothetical protein
MAINVHHYIINGSGAETMRGVFVNKTSTYPQQEELIMLSALVFGDFVGGWDLGSCITLSSKVSRTRTPAHVWDARSVRPEAVSWYDSAVPSQSSRLTVPSGRLGRCASLIKKFSTIPLAQLVTCDRITRLSQDITVL